MATPNASPENQCTQMSVRPRNWVVTTTKAETQLRVYAPLKNVVDSNLELALPLSNLRLQGSYGAALSVVMISTYKSINWNGYIQVFQWWTHIHHFTTDTYFYLLSV